MTEEKKDKSMPSQHRIAWIIYSVLAIVIIVLLVLFVAQDNEERLFYGLMGAAVSYVFRPTEKFMQAQIDRFARRD